MGLCKDRPYCSVRSTGDKVVPGKSLEKLRMTNYWCWSSRRLNNSSPHPIYIFSLLEKTQEKAQQRISLLWKKRQEGDVAVFWACQQHLCPVLQRQKKRWLIYACLHIYPHTYFFLGFGGRRGWLERVLLAGIPAASQRECSSCKGKKAEMKSWGRCCLGAHSVVLGHDSLSLFPGACASLSLKDFFGTWMTHSTQWETPLCSISCWCSEFQCYILFTVIVHLHYIILQGKEL